MTPGKHNRGSPLRPLGRRAALTATVAADVLPRLLAPIQSPVVPHRFRGLGVAGAIALSSLAAACASTGARPRPFPAPSSRGAASPADVPPTPALPEGAVSSVIQSALGLRGVRYRDGGADPTGFDCSGFTQYVFAQAGAALPREVRDQYKVGRSVEPGAQQPGDLVFFATTSAAASHVGIVIGEDEFVHAPSSRGVVRVERISVPYWSSRFVGFRRLTAN